MRIDGKVVLKVRFMYTTYSECVWVWHLVSFLHFVVCKPYRRGHNYVRNIMTHKYDGLASTSISVVRRSCAHLETSLEFRWCHPTKKGRWKSHIIIIIYRTLFVVCVHARVTTSAYHVVITSDINIMCTEVVGLIENATWQWHLFISATRHMSHASDGKKRYCFRTSPIVRMQRESDSDANRMITITTIIICGTHTSVVRISLMAPAVVAVAAFAAASIDQMHTGLAWCCLSSDRKLYFRNWLRRCRWRCWFLLFSRLTLYLHKGFGELCPNTKDSHVCMHAYAVIRLQARSLPGRAGRLAGKQA